MVDVIFALIGLTVLAIAVAAIASTSTEPLVESERFRPRPLRAALGVAFVVVVLVSAGLVRTETLYRTVEDADAALLSHPADALALARRVTASASDLVPAWWVQTAAAAATNDLDGAIEAARKAAGSERFGQAWMTVAILASLQGDRATELDAIARATAGPPVDPIVELNVSALRDAAGDKAGAEDAASRLLEVQPDIEPVVRARSPEVAAAIAAARSSAAQGRLAAGDPRSAFLIALSGDDRQLSDDLLAAVADQGDPDWSQVVEAWFGDAAARKAIDFGRPIRPDLRPGVLGMAPRRA